MRRDQRRKRENYELRTSVYSSPEENARGSNWQALSDIGEC